MSKRQQKQWPISERASMMRKLFPRLFHKIIIWKAQGVLQQNNAAHPKNRNHIITSKQ